MSDEIGSPVTDPNSNPVAEDASHEREEIIFTPCVATRKNAYVFFETATHHERPLFSGMTWACAGAGLWAMGAVETVYHSSSVDIVLNEMFCTNVINERYHITGMPSFTATPISETPVLLTTSYIVQEIGTTPSTTLDGFTLDDIINGRVSTRPPSGTVTVLNVRIRVFAWQINGQPASNIEFAWNCLAEGVITTKH